MFAVQTLFTRLLKNCDKTLDENVDVIIKSFIGCF